MAIYPSTHKTLLKKIQDGDEISWKEFYTRYSPVILALSTRYGLSAADAEDVTQNVMYKIFQHNLIFSYNEKKARFRTYFNQIVRSCIIDHFRKNKKNEFEIKQEELPDQPAASVEEEVFNEEWRRHLLQEALDVLKEHVEPKTFLAFHMLVFQEKSIKDISSFLQINASQIYLAKTRCIAKLKNIIKDLQTEDPELNFQWDCR